MCPAGHEAHRRHDPRRQDDCVRARLELVHDLLDGDDRSSRREHRFLLHAHQTPELHVSLAVGLLRVDHGDVELDGLHRGEGLARERARDRARSTACGARGRCRHSRGARRTAAPTRRRRTEPPCRHGCALRSRAGEASRARPHRGTGAATRRRGCRPTRRPSSSRSPSRSAGRRRRRASSARG